MSSTAPGAPILLVVNDLNPYGSQRVAVTLAREFISHGQQAIIVCLEAPDSAWLEPPSGVPLISLRRPPRAGAAVTLAVLVTRLARLTHRLQPQVILSNMTFSNVVALAAGLISPRKIPVLVVEHNQLTRNLEQERSGRALGILVRRLYPHASRVIGVSDGVVEDLVSGLKVPLSRALRIYDPVPFRSSSAAVDHPWLTAMPRDFRVFVMIAALRPAKGHSVLLRALARLNRDALGSIRVICVGDGPLLSDLVRQRDLADLAGVVDFAGYQENAGDWLAASDALLLPSLWEGFGLVAVEAAQHGLPVLASDVMGVRELIPAYINGQLVPPGDDLQLAQAIAEFWERVPSRTETDLTDFEPSKVAGRYLDVIAETRCARKHRLFR